MVTIRSKILFQVTSTRLQNIISLNASLWMTPHPHYSYFNVFYVQRFNGLWLHSANWVGSAERLPMLMDSCLSTVPLVQPCQPRYIPFSINILNSNLGVARQVSTRALYSLWSFQESRVVSEESITFASPWKSGENNLTTFLTTVCSTQLNTSQQMT